MAENLNVFDSAFADMDSASAWATDAIAREDVFITTKLWPNDYGNAAAINAALEKLDVEYIDLLLLHQPRGDDFINAYKVVEVAVAEGKVRTIGLSNVYQSNFNLIVEIATIPPAVLQNERSEENGDMRLRQGVLNRPERGQTTACHTRTCDTAFANIHGQAIGQRLRAIELGKARRPPEAGRSTLRKKH
jgi:hypothetical protein